MWIQGTIPDFRMFWDQQIKKQDDNSNELKTFDESDIKNNKNITRQQSLIIDGENSNRISQSFNENEKNKFINENFLIPENYNSDVKFHLLTPPSPPSPPLPPMPSLPLPPPGLSRNNNSQNDESQCDKFISIDTSPLLDESILKSSRNDMKDISNDSIIIANNNKYPNDGFYKPQYNSHGKMRKYKCKNCDFIAITKADEWKHKMTHLESSEKLFKCSYLNCPFVTKYKQHFTYHERDHQNDKPFRCEKCEYSCKNKAMLMSHMKSHSTIFPYNCKNCGYVTKHCHQLKLHLRKYNHEPGFVLNEQGLPDPDAIIDINGRRRGPKRKRESTKESNNYEQYENNVIEKNSEFTNLISPITSNNNINQFNENFGLRNNVVLPYLQMLANRQLILAQMSFNSVEKDEISTDINNVMENYKSDIKNEFLNKNQNQNIANNDNINDYENLSLDESTNPDSQQHEEPQQNEQISSKLNIDENNKKLFRNSNEIKLKKYFNVENLLETKACPSKPSNFYFCKYCDIYFKDVVVHSLHMGIHSHDEAFKCNMCGEQCKSAAQFFIHLARKAHNAVVF